MRSADKYMITKMYTQPLKMELIQGSEMSANYNLTPGKYPKENIQDMAITINETMEVLIMTQEHQRRSLKQKYLVANW